MMSKSQTTFMKKMINRMLLFKGENGDCMGQFEHGNHVRIQNVINPMRTVFLSTASENLFIAKGLCIKIPARGTLEIQLATSFTAVEIEPRWRLYAPHMCCKYCNWSFDIVS